MSAPSGPCRGEWLAEQASKGDQFTCDRCNEGVRDTIAIEETINGKTRIYCPACHEIILEERKEDAADAMRQDPL